MSLTHHLRGLTEALHPLTLDHPIIYLSKYRGRVMGRPRKQPRRVMTFNINETTAQRIDNLNLSNRSEWANKALLDVMDGRLAEREDLLDRHNDETIDQIRDELLKELQEDTHRLVVLLFNSLTAQDWNFVKIKGRYTLHEQLLKAINDGRFKE